MAGHFVLQLQDSSSRSLVIGSVCTHVIEQVFVLKSRLASSSDLTILCFQFFGSRQLR